MKTISLLLISFAVANALTAATCNKVGYVPGDDGYCYKFNQDRLGYFDAAKDCARAGARLATVTSSAQMSIIEYLAPNKVFNVYFPAFIGYNMLGPLKTWAFDSPSPAPQQDNNFHPWTPDSCQGFHCTTQEGTVAVMIEGNWDMEYPSSYNTFPYICQYANNEVGACASNYIAPVPFKPLNSTGKCYSITDNIQQNQAYAENKCNKYGGHLTKIKSAYENQFLLQQFCWECIGNGTAQAWIGLYAAADGKLTWTDGTKLQTGDYTNFRTNSSIGRCVMMNFPTGTWSYADCNNFNAYTLCDRAMTTTKMPEYSKEKHEIHT